MGVVDLLEAVEIQEQHRHLAPARQLVVQGVAESLMEQDPVRQAGERVVEGHVVEASFTRTDLLAHLAERLYQSTGLADWRHVRDVGVFAAALALQLARDVLDGSEQPALVGEITQHEDADQDGGQPADAARELLALVQQPEQQGLGIGLQAHA